MIVAILLIGMNRSTEPAFECVHWVDFSPLWTSCYFVSNHQAVHAHILHQCTPSRFEDPLCKLEVVLLKYLRVVQVTATAFLAKAIHVIPTESSRNMFSIAVATLSTKSHIEV
jgi:hypothetical protein